MSAQLQVKEIKRDAEELQDQTEFEVGDAMHKMHKVAICFHYVKCCSQPAVSSYTNSMT